MNPEPAKIRGTKLRAVGAYFLVLVLVVAFWIQAPGLHRLAWYRRALLGLVHACGPFAWPLMMGNVRLPLILLAFVSLWTIWLLIVVKTDWVHMPLVGHGVVASIWFATAFPVLAIAAFDPIDHEFETVRVAERVRKGELKPAQSRVCVRVNKCYCWISCEWAEYIASQSSMGNARFRVVSGSEVGSVGVMQYYVPAGYVPYPFEWLWLDEEECTTRCRLFQEAKPGDPGRPWVTEPPFSCRASAGRCELHKRGE